MSRARASKRSAAMTGNIVKRLCALSLIVAIASALACGGDGDPKEAREMYKRALDLQAEQQNAAALAVFRELLEKYPGASFRSDVESNISFIENLFEMERRGRSRIVVDHLKALARACERYKRRRGAYPAELGALVPEYIEKIPSCPWGHVYNYRTEPNRRGKPRQKYFLACFGSDGIPGGEEDAFDCIVKEGEFIQIHEWLR
ncbi:MAG: type II secretion system protein GspG [Acidobacteriota bacterium]|nr:MAG: type II secretion system protein GspG [Acidobacteriota bacterium]